MLGHGNHRRGGDRLSQFANGRLLDEIGAPGMAGSAAYAAEPARTLSSRAAELAAPVHVLNAPAPRRAAPCG